MILKRILDIVGAVFGLVLFIPMFLFIALWIKIDSSGPIFFRQKRIGRREKPFRIWKFRTMVNDASHVGPKVTVSSDPRITRVGRWLRDYKLDELPQFLNVVVGDMSLVGPRPEVPEFVAYYSKEQKRKIFSLRPGITDIASLEYRNENDLLTSSDDPHTTYVENILPRKLRFYEYYVENRSIALDLRIILSTLAGVLTSP